MDIAQVIGRFAAPENLLNIPQDELICRVASTGAQLTGPPVLHYSVGANPVFNPFRLPSSFNIMGFIKVLRMLLNR